MRDGRLCQIVAAEAHVAVDVVDATGDADLRRRVDALARRPFDLTTSPLLRVHLVRRAPRDHVLLLVAHHAIVDGAAVHVLLDDLGRLYAAAAASPERSLDGVLPPLPLDAPDVAVWLDGRAVSDEAPSARAAAPPPTLPTDRPRPTTPSFDGAAHRFAWPTSTARRLVAFARDAHTTPTAAALTAFHALLHRYTGQDVLANGVPVSRRTRPELRGIVGYLVDLATVQTSVAGDPAARDLLRQTSRALRDAGSRSPAATTPAPTRLRTAFSMADAPPALVLPGVNVTPWAVEPGGGKFDLHVDLTLTPGGIDGRIEYDTTLFDAWRIEAMAEHLHTLLGGLVDDPDVPVSCLPLLTPRERRRFVVDVNQTAAPIRDASVPARFAAQVRRTPHAVALTGDDATLSYRALNRRSTRVAHVLVRRGVGPGDRVAVALPRTVDRVVVLLGVLKAGAAYVPIEPDTPAPRIASILADARPRLAVVAPHVASACPSGVAPLVVDATTGLGAHLHDTPSTPVDVAVEPRALAYLTYTSGSTGRPKGVLVEHRSVLRLAADPSYADAGPGASVLHLAPVAFDASTFEVWAPLLNGGRCVVHPDGPLDLDRLESIVREHDVTTLWLTASLFNTVVDHRPGVLASLRQVLTGGEALSVPHVRAARERFPDLRITNGYGPTECTTFTTTYDVPAHVDEGRIPIGHPIANTTTYVLDAHRQPVPAGVDGELFVGGPGVARGYHDDPVRTAERFVPDPFSDDPDARLYRTGDVVRWRPDGALDFVGRRDRQVKIRGHRVEPREVERVLASHPAVAQCAVVVRPDPVTLVGCVTLRDTEVLLDPSTTLRAFVDARLPRAFVPSAVHVVDALPLTPNGKLDAAALLAHDEAVRRSDARPPAETPQTHTEHDLAALCTSILSGRPVARTDDLFACGFDSLSVAHLVAAANADGWALTARDVYRHPTLAGLAARLDAAAGRTRPVTTDLPPSVVPLRTGATGMPLFFSGVTHYRDLARHLPDGLQVFGLLPANLDGVDPAEGVAWTAARNLDVLRRVQPRGPYRLAGFCFHGLVAYEMACRLRDAGETVAFLGLLDAPNPAALPASLRHEASGDASAGRPDVWTRVRRRMAYERRRMGRGVQRIRARVLARLGRPVPLDAWGVLRLDAEGAAVMAYRPVPTDVPLTLFRCMDGADQQRLAAHNPTWGWDALVNDVHLVDVTGEHSAAFRPPHVQALADALGRRAVPTDAPSA